MPDEFDRWRNLDDEDTRNEETRDMAPECESCGESCGTDTCERCGKERPTCELELTTVGYRRQTHWSPAEYDDLNCCADCRPCGEDDR